MHGVLLQPNSAPRPLLSGVAFTPEQAECLLANPLRLDCPLPSRLGLPVCLVPVEPGRELVPVAVGPNPRRIFLLVTGPPHSNQRATRLLVAPGTGFAPGVALGPAYALRPDGLPLAPSQLLALDEVIQESILAGIQVGRPIPEEAMQAAAAQLAARLGTGSRSSSRARGRRPAGGEVAPGWDAGGSGGGGACSPPAGGAGAGGELDAGWRPITSVAAVQEVLAAAALGDAPPCRRRRQRLP